MSVAVEEDFLIPVGHYPLEPIFNDFVEDAEVRKAFYSGEQFKVTLEDGAYIVRMNNFAPGSVVYLRYFHLQAIAKANVFLCRYIYAPASSPLELRRCVKSTIGTYCLEHKQRVLERRANDPDAESSRVSALLALQAAVKAGLSEEEIFLLLKGEK